MTQHTDTLIIGGGLSGLTVAHCLRTSSYGHSFILLEKSARTGGAIVTHKDHGYTSEIGPHGFLDNCRESREIVEDLRLESEIIKCPLSTFVRYVLINGDLLMIPQSPLKIIRQPLISWPEKLRVLAEIWKKPLPGEPTVAEWANHRFGKALLPFLDAAFTGTYAGDIDRLTIDSVMPGIRNLEKQYGSIIRGAFATMKKGKKDDAKKKIRLPAMTSFTEGMERLPRRMTDFLGEDYNLFYNCGATAISHDGNKWMVTAEKGMFTATNLVIALPVNKALPLLTPLSPPPMQQIPTATIISAVFAFSGEEKLPPGFGYLSPEQENRFTLGALFTSNMFPDRAPTDHILFETLVGGRRHPERLLLDDTEIIEKAYKDVKEVLGLHTKPLYAKVLRPDNAIPQMEAGHQALCKWKKELIGTQHNLHVLGFGWEGIGINDMIKSGVATAAKLMTTEQEKQAIEIKKIYF